MVGLHERIKRRKTMPKSQHLPSFIIIGVKKCGTSALSRFLKIHPDLASGGETFFFANNFKDGLDFYKSKMPNTTDDVLTYEKTPNYYRLPVVPDRVRNFQSQISKESGIKKEVKMIYVTCDPVRRTLSDFLHSRTNEGGSEPAAGEFEAFIGARFSKMEQEMAAIKAEHGDEWHDEVYSMYKERRDWFNYTDPISNLVVNGAYSVFYKRWLENFDQRQLLVIDGTEMIDNPGAVVVQAQQFLNIERIIDENNFIFDDERGYYCYTRTGDDTKYCIKGQNKSATKTMSEDMRVRLFNFFEPFSQRLASDLARPPFNWNWNPAF